MNTRTVKYVIYAEMVGIINKNYKYTAKTVAALIAYAVFVALILWY